MRKLLGLLVLGVCSLIGGLALWLAVISLLAFVADRIYSPILETVLALLSPLGFGFLVAAVLAIIIFCVVVYMVKKRPILWL
jgi:hypothetical protein